MKFKIRKPAAESQHMHNEHLFLPVEYSSCSAYRSSVLVSVVIWEVSVVMSLLFALLLASGSATGSADAGKTATEPFIFVVFPQNTKVSNVQCEQQMLSSFFRYYSLNIKSHLEITVRTQLVCTSLLHCILAWNSIDSFHFFDSKRDYY